MNQYACCITKNAITTVDSIGNITAPWPGVLVTTPRNFKYNNSTYPMFTGGVYKFSVPCQNTTNIIIYDGNVRTLLESLTYFVVSGQDDTYKTIAQINARALTSRIHLMCGSTAYWVKFWLDTFSIPNRIVSLLRADTPNGFYDGHVVNEVYINNKWQLFDLNLGLWWDNGNQESKALKDICPMKDFNFSKLHQFKDMYASEQMANNVYHHSSTVDMFLASENMLYSWQKDIMQIPGIIHSDGCTYFYLPDEHLNRQDWVLSLSPAYRVISYSTFITMFYGN